MMNSDREEELPSMNSIVEEETRSHAEPTQAKIKRLRKLVSHCVYLFYPD